MLVPGAGGAVALLSKEIVEVLVGAGPLVGPEQPVDAAMPSASDQTNTAANDDDRRAGGSTPEAMASDAGIRIVGFMGSPHGC
jgi:hypothetical protein